MSVRAPTTTDALSAEAPSGPSVDEPETSDLYDSLEVEEIEIDDEQEEAFREQMAETAGRVHEMGQMGARRIGSLAIGIGVVGIVLNQMSDLDVVANSTGVIDVSGIFQTAGAGLNLLVVGVIIAAAAVLLQLWSGF